MKRRIVLPADRPRPVPVSAAAAPASRGRLSLRYGGEKPPVDTVPGAGE